MPTEDAPQLVAHLLFRAEPAQDPVVLLGRIKARLPDSELLDDGTLFGHPGLQEGSFAPTTVVTRRTPGEVVAPDASQSWAWPQAREAVQGADVGMVVTELFGDLHPPQVRARAFAVTLVAAVEVLRPVAVWLPGAQRVAEPRTLRVEPPLASVLGARMLEVGGVTVMDTVGLHVLGLPDVQVRGSEQHPRELDLLLRSVAAYVVERGDVVADGHVIAGPDDRHWTVTRARSAAGPERDVLDLVPATSR